MTYFETYHVSNSALKSLASAIQLEKFGEYASGAFKFGSLLDALVTEPDKVIDYSEYEETQVKKALLMRDEALKHPAMQGGKMQHEVYRERFEIAYNGFTFHLPAKCKFDNFRPTLGVDLKSTASTSEKAFKAQAIEFDYDMQGAWYMDVGRVDKFWIVGISKCKKPKTYNMVMQRGDENYNNGLKKYQYLAYQYFKYLL